MNSILDRLITWNTHMNDVPRRLLIVAGTVLACVLVIILWPYFWPFGVALIFAMILEPVARLIRRALKKTRAARVIATLLCMILLFGLMIVAFSFLSNRLWHESIALIRATPDFARSIAGKLTVWFNDLYTRYSEILPEDFLSTANRLLNNALSSIGSAAANLSGRIASITISTATSLPRIILSIVFIVMGTFYFSYDRERIGDFFRRTFPTSVIKDFHLVKDGVFTAFFGQIRAQIFISFILMLIIIAGLFLLGQPYALLIGFLIGLGDVLPVIGAGLFLNSWAIVELLLGNYSLAIALFVLYLVVVVVRQIIEPRIVGRQLGLYPLVTMVSMFAGFQLYGALGLIGGPLIANICRVALDADAGRLGGPKQETPFSRWWKVFREKHGKKKKESK
ncbi:MAG: sporulation integral membrane protein YtvI [Clostridia bacterium]|nr:sporulation integral membrane protein YtvI [Clostridia bacterium]MBR5382236.1 sporulation integral membrane protein YtvI [Clostridia bacterium]